MRALANNVIYAMFFVLLFAPVHWKAVCMQEQQAVWQM